MAKKVKNFRTINAFLINDRQELWIPRRMPHKKLFPLCLDSSVGGHVMAGESYDQAFKRELQEELNIEPEHISYKLLLKLTPSQHQVSTYTCIYLIYTNLSPTYNEDDFIDSMWISIPLLQERINNGELVKSDLPILISCLQECLRYENNSGLNIGC